MKELNDENSFVLHSDGATEARFHNSKLRYQVTDLVAAPNVVGHHPDGTPIYGGLPEVVTEYKGEVLHGIILKADLRSFDITIKGYPKTAVMHSQIPIFAMAFAGIVLLNKTRTDLSPFGRERAIECMRRLYARYHHPVTGEFLDVEEVLNQKWRECREQCLQDPRWQPRADDEELKKQLSLQISVCKRQFKARTLTQSEYQKARKEIRERKDEIESWEWQRKRELQNYLREQCCAYLAEKYGIPEDDCLGLVDQLSEQC